MAESEEELKSLLIRVKEGSERAGLRPNINNLRYADDTTLRTESEEKLKRPLDEGKGGK